MVQAAGTPAGTVITNQARVTFRYPGDLSSTTVSSNIVAITVAQVAAVNLAPAAGSEFARLTTVVDYPFSLLNSGNGTDRFLLTWNSSLGLSAQVFIDANGDQLLGAAEISAGSVTQTPDLLEDRSGNFILRVSVPDSVGLTGQIDAFQLTAASGFDPSKRATLSRATTITAAVLALQKSVSRSMPRAGERVMYRILYSNPGNAAATGMSLIDELDPHLRYVAGSASPTPDSVGGQLLRWSNMSVTAWASGYVLFQADVLNNVPVGTEIHNVMSGLYMDGQSTRSTISTEQNFITVQASGYVTVDIRPDTSAEGEPGDTLQYGFVIHNHGALPEAFNLSYTSSQGLGWIFHEDAAGSGRVDPGSPPITSTGTLAGGASYHIVATAVLPVVTADQTADLTLFRVQSSSNPSNYNIASGWTTISIPTMSLTKAASTADPLSGSEITYTISYFNAGHGVAYAFGISDSIPSHTTYVPQSTTLDGTPQTDELDGDQVTVSGGVVIVSLGTVAPNRRGTVSFRVKIL
jgi:large repetitive protein